MRITAVETRRYRVEFDLDFHGSRPWIAEAAVWDLIGKATGQPVWKLLGGRSDRVLAYASVSVSPPTSTRSSAGGWRNVRVL